MFKKNLLCLGDPIIDHYFIGQESSKRFQQDKEVICSGGAMNIVDNIISLLSNHEVSIWCPSSWEQITHRMFKVQRFFNNNELLLETRTSVKEEATKYYAKLSEIVVSDHSKPITGLVIGDYNKGMVNQGSLGFTENISEIDFCVVDSRHRNLNLDLIKTCKCKIWHCSGNEWNTKFARNFDWIIDTDSDAPVVLWQSMNNKLYFRSTLAVPKDTQVIDTCGAGDTMVAAIASYLILEDTSEIDFNMIIEATKFAIEVCQDVVSQPYTAKTTITL